MIQIRISRPEDVTRQRELWRLASETRGPMWTTSTAPITGRSGCPAGGGWRGPGHDRLVRHDLCGAGAGRYRAAYLARWPPIRGQGRGLAGQLLAGCGPHFPGVGHSGGDHGSGGALPSTAFGRNGFRECFVDGQFSPP